MKRFSYKMSFRKTLSLMLIFLALAFVVYSCYPGDEITAADTDIVVTFFDKEADFSTLSKYAMSDTVYTFDSDGEGLVPDDDINSTNENAILNAINNNLLALGFERETNNPADADVFIAAVVTSSTWVGGGCYGGYWSYWYPYYGWCYPVTYTYTTGTILIVMASKQDSDNNGVWFAGINGLLEDYTTNFTSRINENINQAFAQSPYLGEGK